MNRLERRLDPRLSEIPHFHELTEAETLELDYLYGLLDELEANMTLSNTTARMIDRREAEFAVDGTGKDLAQRRAVLIAKLRGTATTTPSKIIDMALAFDMGAVNIDEASAPYTVRVIFLEKMGVPAGIADFIAAVEEVKPAHLVFEYIYKYNTWNDYEAFNKTLDEWEAIPITWEALVTYSEGEAQSAEVARMINDAQTTIAKAVAKLNGI